MACYKKAAEPLASTASLQSATSRNYSRIKHCYKPTVITMLLWNLLVGCVFTFLVLTPIDKRGNGFGASFTLGGYILLGIMQMLYPIGGLAADLHYGRYRIIILSILLIWCGFLFLAITGIMYAVSTKSEIAGTVMALIALIIFVIGFSGFRSNSVQFSLDQLMDASSEEMSSFLHWFVWAEHVGGMTVRLMVISALCNDKGRDKFIGFSSIAYLTFSTTLVFLVYFTRNSFYQERISSNPYRNVWKVLRFAAKHNKPLGHRSAFTYSDIVEPSRIDFAKRIYGGPFEMEIVEDVKTFVQIVSMLFAITPIFLLEVPTSYLFQLI